MPSKPGVKWRNWSAADQKTNPKRVCSTAGCKLPPQRVKETRTDGGTLRRHVYCEVHAQSLEA